MRYIEEIGLSLMLGIFALEVIPMYGEIVHGLLDRISAGLSQAQGLI